MIHKPNGGLSDARNAGISAATGRYIGFVDSDDWIGEEMVESLYRALQNHGGEIAVCAFASVDEKGEVREIFQDSGAEGMIGKRQAQEKYFEDYQKASLYTVAWNKLYARSLFASERYPTGKIHEDEFLTFRLLYQAKGIVYVPKAEYFYRCRDTSIMGEFRRERFQLFDAYIEKMQFFRKMDEQELWTRTLKLYMHMFQQYFQWQKESGADEMGELIRVYREKLRCQYRDRRTKLPVGVQGEYYLFSRLPALYFFLWKMKHRGQKNGTGGK